MVKKAKFSVAEARFMLRAASAYLDDIRKNASDEVIERFIAESFVPPEGYACMPINLTASAFSEGIAIVWCLPCDLAEYHTQSTGAIRRVVTRREAPKVK